jgi:hypothetical protein
VVIGSLSVLGHTGDVPATMAMSIDVNTWRKSDPARVFDLAPALGQGSRFEATYGYYLDPVSPRIATLPTGWETRLIRIELEPGLAVWFLEPNDAAVSKYARLETRDREWIRSGLSAGILSASIIASRFSHTNFLDDQESARATAALSEDRRLGPPRRR